jgi:hypothetical protein
MPEYGLVGLVFNEESGSGSMADDTNHSNRVLFKSFIRITNGPNDPSLKIGDATDIVDDGEICNIVEEAINRDVSAKGILCRRSEAVCPKDIPFFRFYLFKFRSASKSGNLDGLSAFKKHMDQSKSAADDTTIPEEAVDLMGVSIGGNIKVFWSLSQKKIPNASANEIS